jgi:hypothetical protein
MELAHISFERTFANRFNETDSETLLSRRLSSKGRPSVAPDVPSTLLHTTQKSDTQVISVNMSGASLQQSSKVAIKREASQLDGSKVRPQPAKTACQRCTGKRSRFSGRRPCEGCSKDDLDCPWKGSESKAKRHSRRSRSADEAETSQKATKIRNAPLQVISACTRCQHRKSKCSGTRPACTYCIEHQLECFYDVAEGATRTSDLKRRLRESSGRTQALGRVLAVMREGTDDQANEVFTRLRMGDCLQNVLHSLPTYITSPNSRFKQAKLDRHLSGP